MNILKKGMVLSLATIMTLTPAISMAENVAIVPISAPVVIGEIGQEKEADYIEFSGKITEVFKDGKYDSILVANDNKEGFNELRVYLGESVLLSDKTMDLVSKDLLKEGIEVSIFYHKNTPMGLSLPPVLTPDAIVIKETKEPRSVMVSKFDKELLNAEGSLVIKLHDETIIVDTEGNKVKKEDVANRDLIVFYSIIQKSYPAQTSPEKVIVLPIEEETPVEVNEVVLNKDLLFTNDKDITMIPLRFVVEELGYEVKWNDEAKSVEIIKGPQWSIVTIGKDSYNFARMHIELGTAPIISNGKTFVPLSFAEEVLRAEVEMMKDGAVKIVQK